jgi:hypothetical protein
MHRAKPIHYVHHLVPLTRVPRRAFGNACGPSLLETGTVSRSGFWLRIASDLSVPAGDDRSGD